MVADGDDSAASGDAPTATFIVDVSTNRCTSIFKNNLVAFVLDVRLALLLLPHWTSGADVPYGHGVTNAHEQNWHLSLDLGLDWMMHYHYVAISNRRALMISRITKFILLAPEQMSLSVTVCGR